MSTIEPTEEQKQAAVEFAVDADESLRLTDLLAQRFAEREHALLETAERLREWLDTRDAEARVLSSQVATLTKERDEARALVGMHRERITSLRSVICYAEGVFREYAAMHREMVQTAGRSFEVGPAKAKAEANDRHADVLAKHLEEADGYESTSTK